MGQIAVDAPICVSPDDIYAPKNILHTGHGAWRGPTRFAYRWVKGTAAWGQGAVGTEDEELRAADLALQAAHIQSGAAPGAAPVPLSDQACVQREGDAWTELWKVGQSYPRAAVGRRVV